MSAHSGQSFIPAWAGEEDNAALRRLLRDTPMPGRIAVTLEREPDFFRAARMGWDRHYTAIGREPDTGEVFAMCSRSVRNCYLNGAPVPLGYLSQLRILPGHRAHKSRLLKIGFEWLAARREAGEAPFDITTLIPGNRAATRLLTAGLQRLPLYSQLERMETFLIPARRVRTRSPVTVGRGSLELSGEILDCLERFGMRHQFAPCWTDADFSPGLPGFTGVGGGTPQLEDFYAVVRNGKVAGCLVLWDQRAFKQVVVRGYSGLAGRIRPLANLFGAGLPACGGVLPIAWLSHLAVDDDDTAVFEALVRGVIADLPESSVIRWLAVMLAERHPLAKAARRLAAHAYPSLLFAVHKHGTKVDLDGRIPHLEGGLL